MGNSIYIHDHLVIYNNSVISPAIGGGSGEKTIYANASGRAFPIWNTKPGDDKLMSLSIHGLTEQSGIPTTANPVPMRSVGDTGLLLSVMQDKAGSDYQLLNIKESMKKAGHDGILRSVNGIYDEVVYNGKEWKLIQRIQNDRIITCTGVSNHTDLGFCDCYFYPTKAPINGSTPNGLLSTHFVQGNNGVGTINLNNNSPYLGIFRYPTTVNMTKEEITAWLGENEVYVSYQLAAQAEYPLDLPIITTYDEQTYFASNAADIKPRMVARCKVSKALDYIREGLIGYYTGRGRSNTDENKNILPDLSGNGNDLENKNFAYTPDSGYGDGYIQYDGVDDFSSVEKAMTNIDFTILFTISDVELLTGNSWSGLIYGSSYYLGINKGICFSSENRYIMNGNISKTNFNIANKGKEIFVVGCFNGGKENKVIGITLGSINNSPIYACKQKIYDALIYNRELTEEEIKHNYKASCQYNGEDIDGKAGETTASGENGFTVYNSLPGIFEELTVYGKSIQDGTPTPANPIPINSVGDTPLILTISNGTETQQINFGDIKLRYVGTIYDELVFDNSIGKWKLIQRIGVLDNISEMGTLFKDATYTDKQSFRFHFKISEPKNFCATGQILSNIFITATNFPMNKQPLNSCWSYFRSLNVHYIYFNVPLEYDTVEKAIAYLGENYEIHYPLYSPIETELDFESPKTFSGEVTVTTNQKTVLPYMTARIAVGEKLTLPADPLAIYIAGKQTTGEMVFKDQSGNGNDIPLFNIAHSAESGFFQGALRLDGVDDTGRLPLESFSPKITAETSFFFSGSINKKYGALNTLKDNKDEQTESLSTLFINETGKAICYYPIDRISGDNVNILGTPTIIYVMPSLQALDILLSEENNTYFTLSGGYFGNRLQDLTKFDYRYLIIYPRNLTEEEQAIVLKYIKQGIYEL